MDVLFAIEPSVRTSLLFGLSTFDGDLNRPPTFRLAGWLLLAINIAIQSSDSYYFLRSDLRGSLGALIARYPHDSNVITVNCYATAVIILLRDVVVRDGLFRLADFNRGRFHIDETRLRRLRTLCAVLSGSCVTFCSAFLIGNSAWWWLMKGSKSRLPRFILYCTGLFARYSVYSILSNQVVTYYSLIRLWYETINDRLSKTLEHWRTGVFGKDQKSKIRLLAEADALIKDFNSDLSVVYSFFLLLAVAVALIEWVHGAVYFIFNPRLKKYEVVVTFGFIASLIAQICFFIGTSTSASKKAQETAHLLHDMYIENDDMAVKEEVEIFSLQLLHRDVNITACGFFKLDFSLISGMAAAVTTYVLVLVQFQIGPSRGKSPVVRNATLCH